MRRITNILTPTPFSEQLIEQTDATIARIWRNTFPRLPPRFAPAWNHYLDALRNQRARLHRRLKNGPHPSRDADDPDDPDATERAVAALTREIRKTVRRNKRQIIMLIIDAFPERLAQGVAFTKCCPASPLPGPEFDENRCSDTRVTKLEQVLNSGSPQIDKLCAIVQHVPWAHLTRLLGQLFIRRFPHLLFPKEQVIQQTQVDAAVDAFLKRAHWHCPCGSLCPQQKHVCAVK